MIARPIFENFRTVFLDYFKEEVLTAEFDAAQQLIVFTNPFFAFDELVMNICDNILETVYFHQHLELHLYPFGSNECFKISIN